MVLIEQKLNSVQGFGGKTKHGAAKRGQKRSPEYNAWAAIKQRCYNPKSEQYRYYGARGIVMCERWLNSFENFFSDMGNKPSSKHSIDRIDFNGNYEPENCRWATPKEQNNNRRQRMYVDRGGRTLKLKKDEVIPIEEIASILGINAATIIDRYNSGWSLAAALTNGRIRRFKTKRA